MSIFDDIRELKMRNDLEGAWQAGWAALQQDNNNVFLKTSMFWVIHAALKVVIEPIKSRENPAPRPAEQRSIDFWAGRIQELQLALPSDNIDYRLWNLFREIGKFCTPICAYILQSGRELFVADDHKPYVSDKGESPSTVARLARMVSACYLSNPQSDALPAPRVVALIKYAEDAAEDSAAGKAWLTYDKARVFLKAGETQRAREAFLDLLKVKRSDSWAWVGLASTYTDEPHIAISLLATGLTLAHDPKYSTAGLYKIAVLLSESGAYESASKALVRLMEIYKQNGWPPRDDMVNLMSGAWYDATVDASDFDTVIRNLAEGADRYTVVKPETYCGVLQNVHASEKGANIYVSRSLTLSAIRSLFPKRKMPKPGTPLKLLCDIAAEKPEVVSIEFCDQLDSPDIRFFDGPLSVSSKGFGFVNDDIFVLASLVSEQPAGTETQGIAVMSYDKSKDRYAWKAITLQPKHDQPFRSME